MTLQVSNIIYLMTSLTTEICFLMMRLLLTDKQELIDSNKSEFLQEMEARHEAMVVSFWISG